MLPIGCPRVFLRKTEAGVSQVKGPRDIVEAMGEPNATRASYLLPVYPVPQDKLSLPEQLEFKPPMKPAAPARSEGKPKSPSIFKNKWVPALAVAGTTSGLILLVALLAILAHGRSASLELEKASKTSMRSNTT